MLALVFLIGLVDQFVAPAQPDLGRLSWDLVGPDVWEDDRG